MAAMGNSHQEKLCAHQIIEIEVIVGGLRETDHASTTKEVQGLH